MRELAREASVDPKFREIVSGWLAEVPGQDWLSEVAAIYYMVEAKIRYQLDPLEAEFVQHPTELLRTGAGDCDDMATLIAAALKVVGHPCEFVVVGFAPGEATHVFARCNNLVLDPVSGRNSGEMLSRVVHSKVYEV